VAQSNYICAHHTNKAIAFLLSKIVESDRSFDRVLKKRDRFLPNKKAIAQARSQSFALPQKPILPDSPFFNSWLSLADCEPKLN